MRRAERLGWMTVTLVTALLVLMAATILVLDYWGERRVDECREGVAPGGDAWDMCASKSSFFG